MSRQSGTFRLTVVLALVFGSGGSLFASDDEGDRRTLRGIKAVRVVVEDISDNANNDGLTVDQIRTDVELRFRRNGVAIAESGLFLIPYVYVNAHLLRGPSGLYVFNCEVELNQPVVLESGSSRLAPTWSMSVLGSVGKEKMPQTIRDTVGDLVDRFINAYLGANPK
jgi:hypothetical protein